MQLFRTFETIPKAARGCVLALGSFDGLHRGHQNVIGAAGAMAETMGTSLAVMTTEPHPRAYFKPDQPPFMLTPMRTKARLLGDFGVDTFFVLPFDASIARLHAADFVNDILIGQIGALHLVYGYDYRFGKGRGGSAAMLRYMGAEEGFGVTEIPAIGVGVEGSAGEVYSSTLVRDALRQGLARQAAALLGHWWFVEGHVQKGDQRGRTIGFPTANLDISDYVHPRFGVYAVRVRRGTTGEFIPAVANLGKRPTFDKQDVTLEAHLFDFDEDIYGELLHVEFVSFIRPEKKFSGLEELKGQIAKDCDTARLALANPDNAADRFPVPHRSHFTHLLPD
ncbi:MAG: bifunctional riboflavin kinase/FAD synthetase [Pseudomonadota bacterium]